MVPTITFQKNKNIRKQAQQITRLRDADSSTCRILFKKVAKGLDKKDFVIAQHKLRIKQLEVRVEQLEPRKLRKVRTSLNSKFAGIKAIKKSQIKARDRQIEREVADLSEDNAFIIDYIKVQE